jgi:FKBP-type peptidyl-prolyl cis-trans isomerase
MSRILILSCLTAITAASLLSACPGSSGQAVETVPASVLDPDKSGPTPAPSRTEYKLVKKADTPIYPAPENAYRTSSGLRFVVFKRGKNTTHPLSSTTVTVHYEGYTSDKKIFDSSVKRGEPSSFELSQVVPGWREGVKLMTVGDSFRFWIEEKDAYRGAEGKPAGLLIFDVQLIAMESN